MADFNRALLERGIAAALADDYDTARSYLATVLGNSADVEARAQAWYWLGHIADDPAKKRDYLGNALATQPSHEDARRELVQLETFGDVALPLAHPTSAVPTTPPDSPPHAAFIPRRHHEWRLPSGRTVTCAQCHVLWAFPSSQGERVCPFCGSAQVASADPPITVQPLGYVPFQLDSGAALDHGRRWLTEQRFRPGDLERQARLTAPRAVFVPFWAFDISGLLRWSGYRVPSKWGGETRVRVPTYSQGTILFANDALLVAAGTALPAELLGALQYAVQVALPYTPDVLATWSVTFAYVSPEGAQLQAVTRISKETTESLERGVAPGTTDEIHSVNIDKSGLVVNSYGLLLLPLWITEYDYKGQRYRLIINGQSGQGHGDVPRGGVGQILSGLFGPR